MTEFEDTLTRALAAEADRHQMPVFDAHRIAETAVTRRPFWRRPLFALAAAAIGVGGIGGATVLGAGGGQRTLADAVTVTIQPKDSVGPGVTDASVRSWVRARASMEGLKDVRATVRHSPWRLEVTGHAADLNQLKAFGEPGILQFRPVVDKFGEVPTGATPQACTVSTVRTGGPWRSCDRDGNPAAWIADPVGGSYHVVAAGVQQLYEGGTAGYVWAVTLSFDAAGANAFAAFNAQFSQRMVALMIDGVFEYSFVPQKPFTGVRFQFEAGLTEKQAMLVGAILVTPGPADLEGATVTVSTR